MKSHRILGIYRHPMFSNNAIEADRLILEESLSRIQRSSPHSLEIEMREESEIGRISPNYSLILTMAQSQETLRQLDKFPAPSLIWNSPSAIRNCYRKSMSATLASMNVGYVPFQVLPTDESIAPQLSPNESYWLKRSDFHAIADEDVTLAESAEEVAAKLGRFHSRGVNEVILQRHIHGDIYKFYGVKGGFFRPIRVRSFLDSAPVPDLPMLERMATKSAEALGLVIYGGDAILDKEGNFHLIDVNDWPSFRLCRDDAAQAIAELSLAHLRSLAPRKEAAASAARC